MGGEDRDALELGAPLGLANARSSHRLIIYEQQKMGTHLVLAIEIDLLIDSLLIDEHVPPDGPTLFKIRTILAQGSLAGLKEYDTFIHCVHTIEQRKKWQGGWVSAPLGSDFLDKRGHIIFVFEEELELSKSLYIFLASSV